MTKYREILRLHGLGFSARNIARSVPCSRNTVSNVLKRAAEAGLSWPLPPCQTDAVLRQVLFPSPDQPPSRRMPDFAHIRKELMRNGVTKKLLWAEYLEECRQAGESPLMYSQFCHYIQQDEQKRRATMHIRRKPGEQIEVDWAGDRARLTDPDTGEISEAHIFVGVMTYSQYTYVEAFPNEKQDSWIRAHVHMYEYFGGVARILVPDNCKTAVARAAGKEDSRIQAAYREMAEHYGTAIIPARVRSPKDKPNAEGAVGNISTWIVAALRNEQFFTLAELNRAIREKLEEFNHRPFQKKEGSRHSLFHDEEAPLLLPLPSARYQAAEWKKATVQFNYHIAFDGMMYSVPFSCIGKKVDVRATDGMVEVFCGAERLASHRRLHGRKGQYSTQDAHMSQGHQHYLKWNGDRFRQWARRIGGHTLRVVDALLRSFRVEQQSYRSCMGLLKLAEKYSPAQVEDACGTALACTGKPSLKSIRNLLAVSNATDAPSTEPSRPVIQRGVTRGSGYYGRERS